MKRILTVAVAAASFMLAGCSGSESEPVETVTVTQTPEAAEFAGEFEQAEPATDDQIQSGGLQAEFGDELDIEDLVVAARFNGSKTMDETGEEPGAKVRILEIQIQNNGDNVFDASSSTLGSITTDKGSARQLFDGSNDEPFFDKVGPGESASVRLLVKLPEGAKTATASYTFASLNGEGPVYDVNFTGPIDDK
ncbi:hypothetical protein ACU4IU_16960 [Brevibacterium sp. CSND-B09]|uniref:hypothetical protein n=1 Tax=Brevibacterium sp. CSND-B09 TaxID=3462571 RepID=UPI00406A1C26